MIPKGLYCWMKALPLDLLFDAVKECGVNNDFDERED